MFNISLWINTVSQYNRASLERNAVKWLSKEHQYFICINEPTSDRPRFLSLRRVRGLFHWSFSCLLLSTHDCCQARESGAALFLKLLIRNWKLLIRAVYPRSLHTVWRRLSFPSSLRMRSGLIWLCSSCLSSLPSVFSSRRLHRKRITEAVKCSLWPDVRHIRTNVLCVRGNEIRNIPPTSPAHWCQLPQDLGII